MHELVEQYRSLLETVDAWFARAAARFPEQIICRAGCSSCCRGFFDITLLDAALVTSGLCGLEEPVRAAVRARSQQRLDELQARWPGFNAPFLLNGMPDAEWTEMPEEDMTPCPLLGPDGRCLVYASRPMLCRLHGLPNIDVSGESFSDSCCSLNFNGYDPLAEPALRWEFRRTFASEHKLLGRFSRQLLGVELLEVDTLLPLVPLIDFEATDWQHLTFYTLPTGRD